ncbi:hypothetical protein W911_06920 [Hyphomicrobium nitrativorans NL23]|uniref:Uncharacterized protein n=1 Tax=Hyphomicrobium nitrativorans NL23 TaxID=1029756 RepID=V5SGS0_9HYPH|nr:hypothetical protein W911_06920 [Hyphomicrobium nitrativorans NL23]
MALSGFHFAKWDHFAIHINPLKGTIRRRDDAEFQDDATGVAPVANSVAQRAFAEIASRCSCEANKGAGNIEQRNKVIVAVEELF